MSRKYSRRNYVEVLKTILPEIYQEKDLELANISSDLSYDILRADTSLITKFAYLNRSIRPLIEDFEDNYFELGPWNTDDYRDQVAFPTVAEESGYAEGLVKYFIPQNKLTYIEPDEFILEILDPLGYDINDYTTSGEFYTFFKDTLYPQLSNGEGSYFTAPAAAKGVFTDLHILTNFKFGSDYKSTLRYLINSLGLFQLMNYRFSSLWDSIREEVAKIFTRKIYIENTPITILDAVNVLKAIEFNNQPSNIANADKSIFYPIFSPEGDFAIDQTDTYLSGTQSLEKQYVWNSILYGISPEEQDDTFVKDYLISFFVDKQIPSRTFTEGPFQKFLKAAGFLIGDLDNGALSIGTLNSIEKCPDRLLPYLADTIGWKFYTINVDSWRRQLREARTILQKKGTRQGIIDLVKVILPSSPIDFSTAFKEYHESYIPNLIYFMLKTESPLLASEETWTQDLANEFCNGEYNPSNVDDSVRFVVDHILLEAAHKFPSNFIYQGINFQVDDSRFVFNHRGRNFHLPPWEFEEFYEECDVSEDLVEFFTEKLFCLGVDTALADQFRNYILDNTVRNIQDEYYNNGFVFLTDSLKLAPNYTKIISNYDEQFFDYLPMWNGKSSQFTFSVSSGTFEDDFKILGAFTRYDFFNSLEAIRDFIPAKVDERIDVSLKGSEYLVTFDKIHPRLIYPSVDLPNKNGAMASYEDSTIDMDDPYLGLIGDGRRDNYDFANTPTRNNHQNLTVFKREEITYERKQQDAAWKDNKSPHTIVYNDDNYNSLAWKEEPSVPERTALRRRNFEKVLSKGNLFTRTGFNPPMFLNRVTVKEGYNDIDREYMPLGLIPSSMEFEKILDHVDLPAVYDHCENAESNRIHNGFRTSNAFESRKGTYRTVDGFIVDKDNSTTSPIEARYRDNFDSIYDFIYSLVDKKLLLKSELTFSHNSHIFVNSFWKDAIDSIKSAYWNDYDFSFEKDWHDIGFDVYSRVPNEDNKGINYLYQNNYVMNGNGRENVSRSVLDDLEYGGSSIVSHVYGPIFWNGLIQFDGKNLPQGQKSSNIGVEREFELSLFPSIQKTASEDFAFYDNERSVITLLSGVEIVDRKFSNDEPAPKKTLVSIYNLQENGGFLPEDLSIIGKNNLTMKSFNGNPRLRFSFDYDLLGNNYLEPEDKFSVEVSSLYLKDDFTTLAKSVHIMIRTEVEEDAKGNKVFWCFTKNNKWEYFNYSDFDSLNPTDKLNKFYHKKVHTSKELEISYLKCYPTIPIKESIYSVKNDDFEVSRVEFNTLNRVIKLDMDYYTAQGQVHRKDQRYVVEVVPEKDEDPERYWMFRGMKCVDETKSKRAHVQFDEQIPDYSITRNETSKEIALYYPDSTEVPFQTLLRLDSSGFIYDNETPITVALKQGNGRPYLYKSVKGSIQYGLQYYLPYEGYFRYNNNTKKGLASLVEIINLGQSSEYFNYNYDPTVAGDLSAANKRWDVAPSQRPVGVEYTGGPLRGDYPGDVYDYNDQSVLPRPAVSIEATVIPTDTPWGTNVTIIDCTNVAPVYVYGQNKLDSRIDAYGGANDLYDTNFIINSDPRDLTNDNWYYNTEGGTIVNGTGTMYNTYGYTPGSLGQDQAGAFDNSYATIKSYKEQGILDIPDYAFYQVSAQPVTTKDHLWTVATLVIDRTISKNFKLPDAVALCLGAGEYSPHHWARTYFRAIKSFKDFTNLNSSQVSIKVSSQAYQDVSNPYAFNTPEEYLQVLYWQNEKKNIQANSYDIGKYTLVFLAINCERTFNRWGGTSSGLDFNDNVVSTPLVGARTYPWRNGPALPSIAMMNDWEDWAQTDYGDDARKCSLPIVHTSVIQVIRDEDFIFTKDFFIGDADLKSVIVDGSSLGTFTTSSVAIPYKLNPEELTGLFRFYNTLGDDLQSRDSEVTAQRFGTNGGGRSSYRNHPGAYKNLPNNDLTFKNDQKITTVRVKN